MNNNVDNCSRYCQAPATKGLFRTVGHGGDSGSIEDLGASEYGRTYRNKYSRSTSVIPELNAVISFIIIHLTYLILESMKWQNVLIISTNLNQVQI